MRRVKIRKVRRHLLTLSLFSIILSPVTDSSPSYLNDCLKRKVLFFTGKGGVGKSTLVWATARLCEKNNKKVCVVHWTPLEDQEAPLYHFPGITHLRVDTMEAFKEYALRILKFEKVFEIAFNNPIFKTFVRAAPGIGETVVAGKIYDLAQRGEFDLILVDLPSSGHAVTFFKSPQGVHKLFPAGFIHRDAEKILGMFRAPTTRLDLVTLPEELPVTECGQLKEQLDKIGPYPFGFLHINRCTPEFENIGPLEELKPEVRQWAERYLSRREEEELNQKPLESLGLPLLRHTHKTPSRPEELVDELASELGAQ